MKFRTTLPSTALLLLACPALLHAVPVELGRESFEAAPGIGYTTSVAEFDEASLPNSDFFGKFPNNGTRTRGTIAGGDGSNAFMAEDLDQVAPVGPTQFLTTNSFNIAGRINTSVKVLLAAPGTGPSGTVQNGGHQNHYDHDVTVANVDFVRVEASVDGGPFNRLIMFSPNTNTLNQPLSLDADGDYLGGGVPVLNATFQEFDLPIPTGNSVQVRVVMHTNATNEYLLVDNIRIFGETSATASPVLGSVPAGILTFTEGSAALPLAPAITATDTDSANLASATITIPTGYVNGEDVLSATPSGAILAGDIIFNPATGTLTITRSAPKATYQTVLRSVSYRNTNTAGPNTGTRQVQFRVSDGTNTSNQPIRQVQVTDAIAVQSVPFIESFETDGRGTRYSLDGRFTNGTAFFDRVSLSGVTNGDGTFGIAAEDTLIDAAPVKAVSFLLNTAGLANLTATVRLAAPAGAAYDSNDFIMVEASVNGGAFTTAGNFRSTGNLNFPMAQDTNADNVGDGTALTAALQDFTFNLPAATTLGLRVRFQSNSLNERLVADRIVVNGSLPPIMVTNANDTGTGSLRATVAAALAQAGPSLINFDPAVFNGETADVITLGSGEIVINDAAGVTIDASGIAVGVAIDGGPGSNRLFRISGGSATLQALQLSGGNSAGGGSPAGYGGAIHNIGNLTLIDCSISGCTAPTAGGAIYNAGGTLTLDRSTLWGNSTGTGGAIQNEATLFATNSTFTQNKASQNGGAISSPFGRPATLTHCTVANNTAALQGGGGIGTAFSLINSIVAGNAPDNINGTPALSGTNITMGDPRLAPLARNGGRSRTMHPLPGSPARDRITTTIATTDQRGLARSQWGASDAGSVEAGILADCAWEVRDVWTSPVTTLTNLANVDAMLANPAAIQITGTVPFINFSDLNGMPNNGFFTTGDSLFLCDNLTPQGLANQDDDSFATQARAFLTITTGGDYTFGFSSDDGARLRLYSTTGGVNPAFTSSTQLTGGNPNTPAHSGNALTFNAPTGNSATLGVIPLTPGVYGVEFTMWEDFGGSSAEVLMATGAKTAVDGTFSLLGGNSLTRTPGVSRPVNDDFADALPLRGAVVHTASCNAGATIESGEPVSIPAYPAPTPYVRSKSVWWMWTAPTTAGYQVDTIGSSFDTQVAVLTGTVVNALNELAIDDDSGGAFTSKLSLGAVAGTVYRIQVAGFATEGSEGNIRLNIGPAANFTPGFTVGPNQNVFTSAGPQSVAGWATGISPGAPWETTQSVTFLVTTTNPSLFIGVPSVSPDGTLIYVPAPAAGGTATVSVSVQDNGSPPLTSAAQTFTITTSLAPTTGTPLTINAGGTGTGTAAITQNFNSVSSASVLWVDNSTVPGWYAQINDGLTASGTFQPSNGATALNGLINCGSTANPAERSLGSKATSTGGFANISYAVVLRNVGPLPVKLSRLRYAEELWRSGSAASAPEKVTLFYAISDSPLASIASGPTNATAAAGAGFTALPAGANTQIASTTINTALDGNLAANRSAVDFTPAAGAMPAIFPGQYLTVKWTDTNEAAGSDGHQAIDDVILDFAEVPCALYAVVNNIVRNYVDGPNDTVDVSFTVGGVGSGLSPLGWQVTAPAVFATTGTYGVPRTITGLPLSAFTPTPVLAIRDAADANCTTTVTLPLPLTWGYNFLTSPISYLQAGGTIPASPLFRQTAPNDLTFDPGSGVLTTDAVALTPGTEKCLSLQVFVVETSINSGFEALDTLKVELLSSTPAGIEIETLTHDYDLNGDGFLSGGATPLTDEFNLEQRPNTAVWTSPFLLVGTVPASATSMRLRISAVINGNTGTEVYRFGLAGLRECLDGDGDGITDFWEFAHGTNGSSAASRFGQLSATSTPAQLTLSLPTGNNQPRTYQLLFSPDMRTWTRDGLPVAGHTDPTGANPLLFTRPLMPPRQFYRALVQMPQQ